MSADRSPSSTQPRSQASSQKNDYVVVGVIAQPHGIRGEVRAHLFNRDSDILSEVKDVQLRRKGKRRSEPYTITHSRFHTKGPLLRLKECPDRTHAEELRGAEILIHNDDMPELSPEEYYYFQMEGLPVFDTHTGDALGTVLRVMPSPAQDLLEIDYEGRKVLVPLVDELVPLVDLEEQRVEVNPIPGLFDEEPSPPKKNKKKSPSS